MKGFTLIELLIVFAISTVIIGISINSYISYNNSRIFNGAISEFSNSLRTARSRAISQVKPSQCAGTLEGYEVRITESSRDYELSALCGGVQLGTQRNKLPPQVSFLAGSAPNVSFDVSFGTVTVPRTIAISGFGKSSTINITTAGIVSVSSGQSMMSAPDTTTTPQFGATVTPTAQSTSTSVVLGMTPNPSNVNQNVTFTVTVTGINCEPQGVVRFYQNGTVFTATGLSGTNTSKSGSAGYSFNSSGTRSIHASYQSYSSCPTANSATASHTVQ